MEGGGGGRYIKSFAVFIQQQTSLSRKWYGIIIGRTPKRYLAQSLGIRYAVIRDSRKELLLIFSIKRRLTNQHLVQQHPIRPPVHGLAVRLVQYDFGGYVVGCSAECLGGFVAWKIKAPLLIRWSCYGFLINKWASTNYKQESKGQSKFHAEIKFSLL